MNYELSAVPMLKFGLRIMNFELRIVGCTDYEPYNYELSLLAEWIFIAQQFLIIQFVIGAADNS